MAPKVSKEQEVVLALEDIKAYQDLLVTMAPEVPEAILVHLVYLEMKAQLAFLGIEVPVGLLAHKAFPVYLVLGDHPVLLIIAQSMME